MTVIKAAVFFGSHLLLPALFLLAPAWLLANLIRNDKKEGNKMKVKALYTGFDLTENKIYDVIYEYDTVYELRCDSGVYCRPKEFFEVVREPASE